MTGLGRRTREEIAKWDQMTALRFQTGGRHQTSPASLRGEGKKKKRTVVVEVRRTRETHTSHSTFQDQRTLAGTHRHRLRLVFRNPGRHIPYQHARASGAAWVHTAGALMTRHPLHHRPLRTTFMALHEASVCHGSSREVNDVHHAAMTEALDLRSSYTRRLMAR